MGEGDSQLSRWRSRGYAQRGRSGDERHRRRGAGAVWRRGGSTASTKTIFKPGASFHVDPAGRNVFFGVREFGMCAAVNGMAVHGGLIPFGSTFFTFSDYCKPALRFAALMQIHSLFVFTHDSIGLGEDGPTHQPIEHLMMLRACRT